MILNIGQKLCKKDNGKLTGVYRIISTSHKDFYKVQTIMGDKLEVIDRYDIDDYILPEVHCKLFLEKVKLKDGSYDLCVNIYNPFEAINYPFFAGRFKSNFNSSGSICKYEFDTFDAYKEYYDVMMYDIEEKESASTIDLYLNDSIGSICSLIRMDYKMIDFIKKFSSDNNIPGVSINQHIEAILDKMKFLYWFHFNFKVFKVPFTVDPKSSQLRPGDIFTLEAILQNKIVDYMLIEYYHDISLYDIKGNFIFILDNNDRTFIFKFVSKDDLPGIV